MEVFSILQVSQSATVLVQPHCRAATGKHFKMKTTLNDLLSTNQQTDEVSD